MQASQPAAGPQLEQVRKTPRRRIAAACETCKRRKERCDGAKPCGRCSDRGVGRECIYLERNNDRAGNRHRAHQRASSALSPPWSPYARQQNNTPFPGGEQSHQPPTSPGGSEQYARMIRDRKGSFMYIGDSANLSFLQIIRRVVSDNVGSCGFVDDPLRYFMVEASPEGRPTWTDPELQREAPVISLTVAQDLVRRYVLATNCILDLFDEAELLEHVVAWVEKPEAESAIPSAVFYLVLAIGAQASHEHQDALAESLFTHGRYLTAQYYMEDASMSTVQTHALITAYLLAASRRNAAFMQLGFAVRAAYAIGLHRKDISVTFSREDFIARERLWKGLRIFDLFMSASLGRPPSTSETRSTEANEDYSASNDLCAIFEKILTDVYARRMISTDVLTHIGSHHRRWAARFFRGLATDNVQPSDVLERSSLPNIGLLHMKGAYYWSIILLTRPFLVESITLHAKRARLSSNPSSEPCTTSDTNKILINACVDSAIRIIDLLKPLLSFDAGSFAAPKRLPFLSNFVFIAALVLGLAYFGDLNQVFPLQRYLQTSQRLLAVFPLDVIAQRNAGIIAYLYEACEDYAEKRTEQKMDYQSLAIGSMFGQIHRVRSRAPSRNETPGYGENVAGSARDEAVVAPSSCGGAEQNVNNIYTQQTLQDSSAAGGEDYRYAFDLPDDFESLPFPPMTPRTLWFDSLDGNMPLFSTISNSNNDFTTL